MPPPVVGLTKPRCVADHQDPVAVGLGQRLDGDAPSPRLFEYRANPARSPERGQQAVHVPVQLAAGEEPHQGPRL